MSEVIQKSQEAITKGSKSFSLAAKFFSREEWIAACQIYYWCRHCDDVIDEGGTHESLQDLRSKTLLIWQGVQPLELPFLALKDTVTKFSIPHEYPMDLLEGMGMDVNGYKYKTLEDLRLYCYRVASTVGLMMSHVMGLYQIEALDEAAHLGMAMQMTNISRDVKEDFLMQRCYLPEEWLTRVNITPTNFMDDNKREELWSVVKRLIGASEILYFSGLSGIKHLPLRSAYTILIAGKIYREIGREMLRKGKVSLESRTVVPMWRKVFLIIQATWEMALMAPQSLIKKKRKVVIDRVWRLT